MVCHEGAVNAVEYTILASAWDFQQCGILTCVDSDEPVQPPSNMFLKGYPLDAKTAPKN